MGNSSQRLPEVKLGNAMLTEPHVQQPIPFGWLQPHRLPSEGFQDAEGPRPWNEICPPCWTRRTAIPLADTMGASVAGKERGPGWYRESGIRARPEARSTR